MNKNLYTTILNYFVFLGQDVDEDELEAELEALEQEQLDNDLLGVGTSTAELPEVPSGDIKEPAAASKEKEKKKGKYLHYDVSIVELHQKIHKIKKKKICRHFLNHRPKFNALNFLFFVKHFFHFLDICFYSSQTS